MAIYRDDWRLTACFKEIGVIALVGGCAIASGNPALAQVTPDATLGAEGSVVTSPIPGGFLIDGGATRGTNLFHSFSQFSVPTNGIALFNNALTIQNIISRVMGTAVSNIDGLIAANGTANLFLINPNGIIFGPNASLNVGGSFLASTADSLIFGNGFEFSATNPQAPPLLTVNVPLGLQTGANPGRIVNQSKVITQSTAGLTVQPGRTLGLVGGEVVIEGGILFAPDGRIELGSVAGNSRVSLTPTDTGYALSYGGIRNFQNIRLSQVATASTSGEAGGSIQVQGRNVTLIDGSQIVATTLGGGKGGGLTVIASESVQMIGSSVDGRFSSLGAQAFATATGEAGDLNITTSRLLISAGAFVSTSTFGEGSGGNLTVNAAEDVQVLGTSADGQFASGLRADAAPDSTGDAGDLSITTSRLLISAGGQVSASTFGQGSGGNLTVNAAEDVQVLGTSADGEIGSSLGTRAEPDSTGAAGDLSITTSQLLISAGAFVSAGTSSSGDGGNLTVNAAEDVQVLGTSADGENGSSLGTQADRDSTGAAGDLSITTSRLLISAGGQVSASTFGQGSGGNLTVNAAEDVQVLGTSADGQFASGLRADAAPGSTGDAGDLSITTSRLLISGGGQVSTVTLGQGSGGNLTVNAAEDVQVLGTSLDGEIGSKLSAQTQGIGNAGDLSITTSRLLISGGGQVSAGTFGEGRGGSLTVDASESVQVLGTSLDGQVLSALFVDATDVDGIAGNLTITTGKMSVSDGAVVAVNSLLGQAGNLTITADSLLLDQGFLLAVTGKSTAQGGGNIALQGLDLLRMDNESLISASALENANGGNVTIDSTFIVATPPTGRAGSDIIANAVLGNGGRVDITTQGLFGTQFRPKLTPLNDITVSSEFGINGEVAINQPDVDPSRGLAQLPTDVVNAEGLIDRRCTPAGAAQRSSFVITGRGGLPPSPNDPLQGEAVITNWVTLDSKPENTNIKTPKANSTSTPPQQLVEAQSWVYDADGRVILVAQAPTATPQSPWQTSPSCRDLQTSVKSVGREEKILH